MGVRFNPYFSLIDLIVLIAFVFAFINAEGKERITLTAIAAGLFLIPFLYTTPTLAWIFYVLKILFGLACLLYVKSKRFF